MPGRRNLPFKPKDLNLDDTDHRLNPNNSVQEALDEYREKIRESSHEKLLSRGNPMINPMVQQRKLGKILVLLHT